MDLPDARVRFIERGMVVQGDGIEQTSNIVPEPYMHLCTNERDGIYHPNSLGAQLSLP
jgi:hypothetical protein